MEYEIIPELNMISVLLIQTTVLLTVTAQSKSLRACQFDIKLLFIVNFNNCNNVKIIKCQLLVWAWSHICKSISNLIVYTYNLFFVLLLQPILVLAYEKG